MLKSSNALANHAIAIIETYFIKRISLKLVSRRECYFIGEEIHREHVKQPGLIHKYIIISNKS